MGLERIAASPYWDCSWYQHFQLLPALQLTAVEAEASPWPPQLGAWDINAS